MYCKVDMSTQLYFVDYDSDNEECPVYTGGKEFRDGEWTNNHEWNYIDPNPFKFTVTSNYSLKIDESKLNIDYCEDFVSKEFLDLLDYTEVEYRAIPYEIILRGNKKTIKDYFILLLVGRFFLLDETKSDFSLAINPNTHGILMSKIDERKPVYDIINNFYIKNIRHPNFFICEEIDKIICTEEFKNISIERNIIGIKFSKIEDGFFYDPWGGL